MTSKGESNIQKKTPQRYGICSDPSSEYLSFDMFHFFPSLIEIDFSLDFQTQNGMGTDITNNYSILL